MKLADLIAKKLTNALIALGVLSKPKPSKDVPVHIMLSKKADNPKSRKNKRKDLKKKASRGRPKGSKNKKKGKKDVNTK